MIRVKHKRKKRRKRKANESTWTIVKNKTKKNKRRKNRGKIEIIAVSDGRVLHSKSMTCSDKTTAAILKTLQYNGYFTSLVDSEGDIISDEEKAHPLAKEIVATHNEFPKQPQKGGRH